MQSALTRRIFEQRWLVATMAVLAGGLAVRLPALSQGYWFDEVVSAVTARLPVGDLLFRSAFHDSHSPLYYLLLSAWTGLFGQAEWVARLLSLLFAMSTLVLLAIWVRGRGQWAAFLAVCLLSLSTFHAHYSVEVRAYGLVAFLVLAYLILAEKVGDTPDVPLRNWVLLGVVQCLTVLSSGYTVPLVLAANLHFFTARKRGRGRLLRWALVQIWSLAACSVWLPVLMVQWFKFPGEPMTDEGTASLVVDLLMYLGLSTVHPSQVVTVVGTVLPLAAAAVAIVQRLRHGSLPGEEPDSSANGQPVSLAARVQLGLGVVACLGGPLLSVVAIPTTETTLPLLVGELARSYPLIIGALFLLLVGPMVNSSLLSRGHGLPMLPFVVLLSLLSLGAMFFLHKPFHPRQVLFLVPLLYALAASAWHPMGMMGKAAVAALLLALTGPALTDRELAFEPRTDLRSAAQLISTRVPDRSQAQPVFVIPMWDRPALEFYLGEDRAEGIMIPQRISQAALAAESVTLVLTREAFEQSDAFRKSVAHLLGRRFQLKETGRFRGVFVACFVRSQKIGATP